MRLLVNLIVLAFLAFTPNLRAATNVFEQPLVFGQHQRLVNELQRALRRGDSIEMERVSRAGVALMPDDFLWRYNLACALARQKHLTETFDALDQAVELGLRDEKMLATDPDLAAVRDLPMFQMLLQKIRDSRNKPVAGKPQIAATLVTNGVARVSTANTIWDMQTGHFRCFFAFPTNPPSPAELSAQWNGPALAEMRPWLAAGTAAGNFGDLYDNRDDGHSRLDIAPFPGLSAMAYNADARHFNAHFGTSAFIFNAVVVGNASLSQTTGPYWRSLPRNVLTTEGTPLALYFEQYLANNLFVYPAHHDYNAAGHGDLFPMNQPYVVITQGSSFTDQPFLRAIFATLAAFTPETKHYLISHGLLMPTVQMLLRASQNNLTKPDDYLTGRAHPTVFDVTRLDIPHMVRLAHDMTSNDVPPLVSLRTLMDHSAQAGVDYFDLAPSDMLCDTPCAIGRILRGVALRRTITIGASMNATPTNDWHLVWTVLHGDPLKVTILPLKADQSQAEISVLHHVAAFPVEPGQPLLTPRVDVGVFATNGRFYSAPAFISFLHLENENRTYSDDGRILSVDYASATNRYTDPVLSLHKNWRDEYQYDREHHLRGWKRKHGMTVENFNARGERIEEADKLGRPVVTRTVRYMPRGTDSGTGAPELVQVDGSERIHYSYSSDNDFTGEVASHEHVAP